MDQAGFIAGIDFGTSKIVGVLGRKNEQGVITILASESIPADTCMKYGVIYNIDEAAGKVKKLINLLENKVGKKIGKTYVSISGRSLRAIDHMETKVLDEETPVTFAMLDEMEQRAKQSKPEFMTNYGVIAPEYFLDGQSQEDPIDKPASSIEVRYRLITGRPNIKNNIVKVLTEKAGIPIAGFIVGPVSSAILVLDEADRQAGCALVEFGAGTTTLSIYKNGLLKFLTVIPFGGRTITKDIQALGFVQEAAESYKIRYGRLGKRKDKTTHGVVNSDVDVKELNKVIQLRQDEIIFNVINQIKESGYADQLEAGIVMIGAASQLAGMSEYLAEKSELSVKRGTVKRVYINNAAELAQNPAYTQSLGILLFANENCEKKEEPKPIVVEPEPEAKQEVAQEPVQYQHEEPVKSHKKEKKKDGRQRSIFDFFEKMQNFGGTMFTEEDDDEDKEK
ncbi:cell division protein FtsA [Dysgonomonas massiliensis]|uniref:cell division protein FtsA n=1 Tax=Dysgonomonas massiliensis TaxID=2040292 RepID=UPI000C7639DF|nr:cell division protein FtsA [Dysgonomonas massiliensis]